MAKGTTLGKTAVNQIGEVVRWWMRDYANPMPPPPPPQPVIHGDSGSTARWGVLKEDLIGGTTEGVLAREIFFNRNDADAGSRGAWADVQDSNGDSVEFLVIDALLPSSKKIPADKRVCCVQVAGDVWAVIAAECPVDVDEEEEPPPEEP